MKIPHILVIDDDQSMCFFLKETIEKEGYLCDDICSGSEAIDKIKKRNYNAIILDLKIPDIDGLTLLPMIREIDETVPVIMITAYGSEQTAKEAIRLGVWDYFKKPFDIDELRVIIKRALEKSRLEEQIRKMKEDIQKGSEFNEIIGTSGAMQEVFSLVNKVILSDVTVMLYGESGTGKELIASIIHHNSKRRNGPFVRINCAAIPESLLESELFGYEKGAFTGAEERKTGKFEFADGGTLFLDEVGDMALSTQAKLLRVLELKEFERVGGKETIKVDIRLIAATNQDISVAVKEKKFREDLYFRLNVVPVHLPPLRERRSDIPLLIDYFIKVFNSKFEKNIVQISPETAEILLSYDWPGNVRELENIIQRAIALADSNVIEKDALPLSLRSLKIVENITDKKDAGLYDIVEGIAEQMEKKLIHYALEKTGWSRTETAKLLKICRKSLHNKMKKYGLTE